MESETPSVADTQQAAETTTETVEAQASTTDAATNPEPTQAATEQEVAKDEKKDEPTGAPESYADFTAPDGVELDTDVLEGLKTLGKELNLTQDAAQKVFDLGVKLQANNQAAWQAQMQKWVGEVKADKEIGGDKLPENLSVAKKAVDHFGGQELKDYLDSTGLGNHPGLIKAFYRIGKSISEDTFVPGGKNTGTAKSLEQRLYPNQSA